MALAIFKTKAGAPSRNVTGKADSILDLSSRRPEQAADESAVADETSACVALVPVVATTIRSRNPEQRMSRAEFVTQLIATAEHVPQTCSLRRGSPADAQAAYDPHISERRSVTRRTKQII